jgi:hypothetical protein
LIKIFKIYKQRYTDLLPKQQINPVYIANRRKEIKGIKAAKQQSSKAAK